MATEIPSVIVQHSQLPQAIDMIEELVAQIPPDQIAALKAIELSLEVINSYGVWLGEMKKEIQKLAKLNQSQAEMIANQKAIVV